MSINPKEFKANWTAKEFYDLTLYLAWEGKCARDYSELMAAKSRK